jgi:ATP-dependent DNA ligase
VTLPITPPILPMLAKALGDSVPALGPKGQPLAYEPKWDGFRCLIFKDGDTVFVQSRSGENLAYAFPEIVAAARRDLPDHVVLDGELVIAEHGRLWFELLGQRIRPRSEEGGWKIAELSTEHPASYVAFDVLALGDQDLTSTRQEVRREVLDGIATSGTFHRTPSTRDPAEAAQWFELFEGAGLDGVIAKPVDGTYEPDKRTMFKIKHARTADVVVGGWRPYKQPGGDGEPIVGSLLLGLYDEQGRLHHIGVASSFTAKRREELVKELAPLAVAPGQDHPWIWGEDPQQPEQRQPGVQSRWTGKKDLSFVKLRPELVAEVAYDHMEGTRLRHVAKFLRFRPDRTPQSCTYEQLDAPLKYQIGDVVPGLG